MDFKLRNVSVEVFRRFHSVQFEIGSRITVISGQNGVGKSNLVSLIASGSGQAKKATFGSNFQPEFYNYFHVDPEEPFSKYFLYLTYKETESSRSFTKKLTFKDDTASGRGIRVIPRTAKNPNQLSNTLRKTQVEVKALFGVGPDARVPVPTIYLSLSRLYPLGEKKDFVTIRPISKKNKLYQNEADKKFMDWYNAVIPGSIKPGGSLSVVKKNISSRASLHMDMDRIPTLSQSVGQDNIGNIISALVDIYVLSQRDKNYHGALICIDEIEVSLHPDTQIKLLRLLEKLSDQLNIQFILSTHSLTILKEMLKREEGNPEKYSVVYLKNPSSPAVMKHQSYPLLKADLLGHLTFDRIKPKVYFEDKVGEHLFSLLAEAIKRQEEVLSCGGKLRGLYDGERHNKLCERLHALKRVLNIKENIRSIVMGLGCETLLTLSEKDRNYFMRVIFLLDGDARIKEPKVKPNISNYLEKTFSRNGINDRQHLPNVCFLPGYFAPESYLFKIVYDLVHNETDHYDFWGSLDDRVETSLYTASKLRDLISKVGTEFNNDDLKDLFQDYSAEKKSQMWRFIDDSELLNYYYGSYETVEELVEFFEKLSQAYNITYSETLSNRFA